MNPQDHTMNNNGKNFYRDNRENRDNLRVSYSWKTSSLLSDPICMPVQASAIVPHQERINSSPWLVPQSGFSSTSPPGTASTSSSPHSDFAQSPDDLSVDSLISSLLGVVNSDDFNPRRNIRQQSPIGNCRDCTDLILCDSCLNAISIMQNQQQQLSPLRSRPPHLSPSSLYRPPSNPSVLLQMEVPSPSLAIQAAPIKPVFCKQHPNGQRVYCQTCSVPFCADCSRSLHTGHTTVPLMDVIDRAGHQANQVLHDAQLNVASLREDLESVQIAAELLEQRSRQATTDVRLCVRRTVQALESREKELVETIEKCHANKLKVLQERSKAITNGIDRLTTASNRLQNAMEVATVVSNPLDVLMTKDMAAGELFHARSMRRNWQPLEENWISFTGPESTIMNAIATLGNVITSNPGPIGDRRSVRGRGNGGASPQVNDAFANMNFFRGASPAGSVREHQNFPLAPIPRGRAISDMVYPVVVNPGLIGPQAMQRPVVQIGYNENEKEGLCRPWGVTCDRDGNVIIADRSNDRVQIFRMDGTLIRRFGSHGSAPGQFDRPAGIAVDARRRIVVCDKDNHRIQVLTMEGKFLLTFGEKGNLPGEFNYPWDVAVNSECQIVVSDTRNHRVQLFSPEGVFLRKYGFESTNSMYKTLDSPRGVAFNPEGNIAVTDFNNHRVVVIDSDCMNSRILSCDVGHGNRQVQRPQGLIVDDEGNIVVADSRNHRVLIFDSSGTLKGQVGTPDRGPQQMDRPSGVALTPDGRILVVDFGNNRVLLI